jgi:hypothetical protein
MSYFGSAGGILQPLGIDLERSALGVFGDAVDQSNRIDAFKNLGLSDADARALAASSKSGEFNVRPAAGANVQIQPKQRFLFQVEFVLHPNVYSEVNSMVSDQVLRKFGFFVKQIDRPKVEYTYEDVNMYNFRTRVLTKVTHQPLSMNLWDDARNTVGEFVNLYRKAYTPMARQETIDAGDIEKTGFTFSKSMLYSPDRDFSSRAALPNNAKHFLKEVRVKQIYSTHSSYQQSAFALTEYTFFNPVITAFDFDDVNHETSESNGISMQFSYDALHVEDYTVKAITKDTELPDYYHFDKGDVINDNLLTLKGAGQTKAGTKIPGTGLNFLDEAKRAIMSGNPMGYVKERGMDIFRNGTNGSGGISGMASGAMSSASSALGNIFSGGGKDNGKVYIDP